jgi:conjugative element/phage-associated large polyvalent protein
MNKQGTFGYSPIWPESVSRYELMRNAMFDVPSSGPWAIDAYWLRSSIPLRANGGILGSLTRSADALNSNRLGWPQSALTPGGKGGILAPLARSIEPADSALWFPQAPNADAFPPVLPTMLPLRAQADGDVQKWETPSDASAQFSAEPAKPSLNSSSQNRDDASVRSPAARNTDEPNRSYPNAATPAAQPAPPTDFRTRLLEALSDKNLRYYAGPGFSEFIDKLAALVPLLPGSGTVQSMQDSAEVGKNFQAGNYGRAATHLGTGVANLGLDWLPFGKQLAILGGMGAKTFPWMKLKIAEAMEKAGKSVNEIWRETGLERGADSLWRFEISDRGYRVKPYLGVLDNEGFRVAPLYEHQVHPGMQAAYPDLAEAKSKIRIHHSVRRESGAFTPGSIEVEMPTRPTVRNLSTHELQHMIGHREGWARGGSPLEFLTRDNTYEEAHELYRRLANEVEARNAVRRLYESEAYRQRWSPQHTEDRPRHLQIIRPWPKTP